MVIACLGWGSLIWDPRSLPIQRIWFPDGPILPIEFARESRGSHITLVLVREACLVRSLWTLLLSNDVATARRELAAREKTLRKDGTPCDIGYWTGAPGARLPFAEDIANWAARLGLDAVVWTALPAKFAGEDGRVPTEDEVIAHLRSLPQEKKRTAEEYVRRAPPQIDTPYRRRIEAELGWKPIRTV